MKSNQLLELRTLGILVAEEGVVLLENKNNILPLINRKVAVFGRIQFNYYKSGTGSGGLVNVTDVPSFIDSINENSRLTINKEILKLYKDWVDEHPFNFGNGMWASEPWSQEEYLIEKNIISKYKKDDDIPIMFIGRTAGEDRDNHGGEGSYKLSSIEYEMIKRIKEIYGYIVVVLNVGNIIDLNFVKELDVDGLVMGWHGGQDGARALIDVLTGYISPSGKLPNTIFKDLNKHPANDYFGTTDEAYYVEDIYVGYRFFETFMKEEVLYPFGFGLSYTKFDIKLISKSFTNNNINLKISITNIGDKKGREVVQVYYNAPQGKLGKPKYQLVSFLKTKTLDVLETEIVEISFDINKMASYDDVGVVSLSSYVLEEGIYKIYFGSSIRDLVTGYEFKLDNDIIVEQLTQALAPVKPFKRIKPVVVNNEFSISYEEVPLNKKDIDKLIKNNIKDELTFKKDKYKLFDVYKEKITLDDFISSLSVDDLKTIVIGEGMSSSKVTSGTAAAIGGITDSLLNKDIPIVCCADGPSGIRMDSGQIATSLPNGTLIASTFNPTLIEELYRLLGLEMRNYNVDILLGPGMNIHRHPLNGRNFEYFSEDPLLSGIMASSCVRGLNKSGVYGAMKHLACNNQETARTEVDSIVSERALREIYLKGFEIAVKESKASVIMTSYNPINGIWAASNYDLNTTILRDEWGFDGFVMTDWWAKMNDGINKESSRENLAAMIRSQNDIFMVTPDVLNHKNNLTERLSNNELTLYELQRSAKNLIKFILNTQSFKIKYGLKLDDLNKKIDYWLDVSRNKEELNFVNNDKITLKTCLFKDEITDFDLIERKKDITYAIAKNRPIIYKYGLKNNIKKDLSIKEVLEKIELNHIFELSNINWVETKINLFDYVNFKTDNKSFNNISKDSLLTYQIKVLEYGNYVIHFEISSELSNITQMPFSIYVGEVHKSTITSNGTNGNKVWINSRIAINEGISYLTFKFHKTGLNLHKIKIVKHG